MTDHLVNVQQELVHTQQLVDAKKKEVETEDHIKALRSRFFSLKTCPPQVTLHRESQVSRSAAVPPQLLWRV
eukprot:427867-Amphidinium_carterae.1